MMKAMNNPRSHFRRVRSMHELQLEKARIRMEEVRAKDRIKDNFRQFKEAFALRNIFTTLTTEVGSTSAILSKVISTGKSIFGKKKKKKAKPKAEEAKNSGIVNGETGEA